MNYEELARRLHLNETGAALSAGITRFPTIAGLLRRGTAADDSPGWQDASEMIRHPAENAAALRALSDCLAASSRTYDLILQTYQDALSYCWYILPMGADTLPDPALLRRNYAAAYRLARSLDPVTAAHELVGRCLQHGRAFCAMTLTADASIAGGKALSIRYLPTDYCRISGRWDGPGKYTVQFNLNYFLLPDTAPADYAGLFAPYLDRIDMLRGAVSDERITVFRPETVPEPEWVSLPPEEVVVFEIKDRCAATVPPLTGMFPGLLRLPDYEQAQMEAVLSPLTAVLTGSLETSDTQSSTAADPVRVSPTVRRLFEALWYRMLEQNNTDGIGLFLAPARELRLQTLTDTVPATNITTTAISDTVLKAGLSGLIPTTSDPKVGVAEQSAALAAQYAMPVCRTLEAYMTALFARLYPDTPLGFRMFGDIFTCEAKREACRQAMLQGSVHDRLRYLAFDGLSLLDEEAMGVLTGQGQQIQQTGQAQTDTPVQVQSEPVGQSWQPQQSQQSRQSQQPQQLRQSQTVPLYGDSSRV